MHDVSIAALAAAALVSAVVALGVEWLAKPRLEARKERILQRCHARDEVWRALNKILYAAAQMKTDVRAAAGGEAAAAKILPQVRALEEAFHEVMLFEGNRATELTARYVGMVQGVMTSDRTPGERGQELYVATQMTMNVLVRPGQIPLYWVYRLRWRYRRQRVREAEAYLGIGTA